MYITKFKAVAECSGLGDKGGSIIRVGSRESVWIGNVSGYS